MARIAMLSRGQHDGERIERPSTDPFPDRLVAITYAGGDHYAVVGSASDQQTGEPMLLLQCDTDGSLTRAAKVAVGLDPDAPDHKAD